MLPERSRTLPVALFGLLWLLALPSLLNAQVSVSLAPSLHPQFTDGTGKLLAGGFLYTYAAGTTTRQDTYTDSTGSIVNAWPIPLDSTGSPSNASGTQVGIWLSNNSYKFCAYNSALVQQWCVDNVSAYQILSNIQNITFGAVTSDPTGAAGEIGYRSDIPCFRGYTSFWDCFATLTGVQTLTNKTIDVSANTLKNSTNTAGHYPRNNGTQYVDSGIQAADVPGVAVPFPNDTGTGTGVNLLVALNSVNPAQAVTANSGLTNGVIGVCVSNCGLSGTALIQVSGNVGCIFDNATTARDYVQRSTTVNGQCHDTGAVTFPPSGGQIIGRTLTTGAAGLQTISLFSAEVEPPNSLVAVESTLGWGNVQTDLGASAPNCSATVTNTCVFATFAQSHKLLRFDFQLSVSPSGCTTAAVLGVRDVTAATNLYTVTITNGMTTGYKDSGALSISMTAGDQFAVGLLTSEAGCGVDASVNNPVAIYQ